MTREEERRQWAKAYCDSRAYYSDDEYAIAYNGYMAGIKQAESHPVNQWHKIKDKLPPEDKECAISNQSIEVYVTDGQDYDISYYDFQEKAWGNGWKITHWTELPKLPELPKGGIDMETYDSVYKSYLDKIDSIDEVGIKLMNDMIASFMKELGVKELNFGNNKNCFHFFARNSRGDWREGDSVRLTLKDDDLVCYVYHSWHDKDKNVVRSVLLTEMSYSDVKSILLSSCDYVARIKCNKEK